MPRHQLPAGKLGPLETEVLRVLWSASEPLAVRTVLDRLNHRRSPELAYTTVMTVMSRLWDKDILRRYPEGRGFVYEPVVADAASIAVRDVMRQHGAAAVAQFVDEVRDDPKLLRRLRRLLEES